MSSLFSGAWFCPECSHEICTECARSSTVNPVDSLNSVDVAISMEVFSLIITTPNILTLKFEYSPPGYLQYALGVGKKTPAKN